ncbi:MAG: ABC transporter permease subunit [Firmicutes bacterium]|nr:ABC transporter permease subunit [Bacillota bacterium]
MSNLQAELIKAKGHRLLWILLAVMVLVEILIIGGMHYWAVHSQDPDIDSDESLQVCASTSFPGVILPTLTFSATFGTIFAVIFISRFSGEEYPLGTAKQMISMGVGRCKYILGKSLASILVSLAFILIPVFAAVVFTWFLSLLSGGPFYAEPITVPLFLQIIKGIGIAWVCLGFYSGLAIFLAIITRSPQTATTIGILMILLEANIINSFADRFSSIARIAPYSMGRSVNMISLLIEKAEAAIEVTPKQDIVNAFITLGVWFAAFLILSVFIFKNQELSVD